MLSYSREEVVNMIASKSIIKATDRLIEKHRTRDPFRLAKLLEIELVVKELGALKGFYKTIYDIPFIFLNRSLDKNTARIVLAHEIGHHLLHREFAAFGFEETSLFSPASRREYEANLFAAELLISDSEIEEAVSYGYTVSQIASNLAISEDFASLKVSAYKFKKSALQ